MGGCLSSPYAAKAGAGAPDGGAVPNSRFEQAKATRRPSEKRRNRLESQLIEAVKDHCANPTVKLKTMNSILMKFARIEPAFMELRELFKEFDTNGDGALQASEIEACLPKLGVEVTDELLNDIFKMSDIDDSRELDFHEFVIIIALIVLLNMRTKEATARDEDEVSEIDAAMNIVADAFAFFDKDADGSISRDEVEAALSEGGQKGGGSHHNLAAQRFKEMDWDGDSTVTFREFLISFTDWVTDAEEE